ncbi:hypothetical protein E4191_06005 [Paracoccus liaowanqingii]|uniref:Uncharacterized protein n=1 Tax=Paracoccus liaowanqingii TaxID=2560053 RepID=A0A4P7HJJ5_9RHOB|nr:hypothetical protein [Paracoccus liaowanqingii]QBX34319.1 hypothetical protein E4191_06005 [Paracoccus liaowanqingii]
MINPFKFRPETPDAAAEPDAQKLDGGTGDWQGNWLSNVMAWGSRVFLPSWCDTPEHWTSRLMQYFQTSCPCCLFFRGIVFGLPLGLGIGMAFGLLF